MSDRETGASRRLVVWIGLAVLMAVPVAALRAAEGRPADPGDYIFLLILVLAAGCAWEMAQRVPMRRAFGAGAGFAVAAAGLATWVNLAVGIIGSEDNPANWIYAASILTAALGAMIARFSAAALAQAATAAALVQVMACVAAFGAGLGFTGPITVFFTTLWLLSASLFRRAAQSDFRGRALA